MPFPLYHIGTNGFFGLLFRKWVDPAVIILANVIVDIEVLFAAHPSLSHRHWHFHSFLVGGFAGALLGLVCWFFRRPLNWLMKKLHVLYEAKLWKMVLAGVLGVWLHVLIDGFYHWDLQPFWPYKKNVLWRLISLPYDARQDTIEVICLVFTAAAILLYVRTVIIFNRKKGETAPCSKNSTDN